LKYKIPLFVLKPEFLKPNPPQGNNDLIRLGGIPLSNGNELVEHLDKISQKQIPQPKELEPQLDTPLQSDVVSEPTQENYNAQPTDIKEKILGAFNGKPLSVQEIIKATGLDWTPKKLTPYLKKLPELEVIKSGRNNLYKLSQTKKQGHPTLFP
jgi:predicted Rossmann fold nucleotide-binding protein DprA/Smf involved in DNA uptake